MKTEGTNLQELEVQAGRDGGIFSDHLRRMFAGIQGDDEITDAVRAVLNEQPCPSSLSFYRLRCAGVFAGSSIVDARLRCDMYAEYLRRNL
jgi:hypothetical protein